MWQEPLLQAFAFFGYAQLEKQRAETQQGAQGEALDRARTFANKAMESAQRIEAGWVMDELSRVLGRPCIAGA